MSADIESRLTKLEEAKREATIREEPLADTDVGIHLAKYLEEHRVIGANAVEAERIAAILECANARRELLGGLV
jgi:hypothetical protein